MSSLCLKTLYLLTPSTDELGSRKTGVKKTKYIPTDSVEYLLFVVLPAQPPGITLRDVQEYTHRAQRDTPQE